MIHRSQFTYVFASINICVNLRPKRMNKKKKEEKKRSPFCGCRGSVRNTRMDKMYIFGPFRLQLESMPQTYLMIVHIFSFGHKESC